MSASAIPKQAAAHEISALRSKGDYVLESVSENGLYQPVDQSLLPIARVDITKLIGVLRQLEGIAKRQCSRIAFKAKGRIVFMDLAEIAAVKAEGNYVSLLTGRIHVCCVSRSHR